MSAKKILLIGFIFVLLVAIPLTVYLVQQEQKTKIGAEQKTNLSLVETPQTVSANTDVKLDVTVFPGTNANQVSFVKFTINYDSTYLATESAGASNCSSSPDDAFCPNKDTFPVVMQGPTYEDGKISVTLSVGNDPSKAVKALATAGTIYFKAKAVTAGTDVTFSAAPDTQVLSIGTNDQFNENVLADLNKATIIITEANVTEAPTEAPTAAPTEAPTGIPQATGPTCTSLTTDPASSGTAPLSVNLTANGESSDSTISKVTFNFGDGQTQDITDSAGIGTNSISVLQSHIYNNPGNYTATAILTDASGSISSSGNCSVAISVNNGTATTTNTTTTVENNTVVTATPTIIVESNPLPNEQPGPGDSLITVGSIGAIITIIGAVLLLAL